MKLGLSGTRAKERLAKERKAKKGRQQERKKRGKGRRKGKEREKNGKGEKTTGQQGLLEKQPQNVQ